MSTFYGRRTSSAPVYPLVHLAFAIPQSLITEAAHRIWRALHIVGLLFLIPLLAVAALIVLAYDDLFPSGLDARTRRDLRFLGRMLTDAACWLYSSAATHAAQIERCVLHFYAAPEPMPVLAVVAVNLVAVDMGVDDDLQTADRGAFAGLPVWDDDPEVLQDYLPLIAMTALQDAYPEPEPQSEPYPEPSMAEVLGVGRFPPDAWEVEAIDACPPLPPIPLLPAPQQPDPPPQPTHQQPCQRPRQQPRPQSHAAEVKTQKIARARRLIAQGISKKAAAKELGIAESTLRTWLKRVAG